ncbi:hypothetical protein BDV96DRAFT_590042 [Lophiotrema nucula]|uniref:Heterokaryon incompatibility domain-containing protein n=1 Tax=Lophiotrema nucula TaxID=690887 RepID=A0A6A5YJ18_9PLEO|nr:hypothetical protein BDV96DRAFT_590042 [Lophiotrema nucula]
MAKEIRLIEIISASHEIDCKRNIVSLMESKPTYAALSDLWGDSTLTQRITINDMF